jgi:hypothetical protein
MENQVFETPFQYAFRMVLKCNGSNFFKKIFPKNLYKIFETFFLGNTSTNFCFSRAGVAQGQVACPRKHC